MGQPKIIFFDIDGTLLSHTKKEIPQSAKDALWQAKEAGIKICIATGRHKEFIERGSWLAEFPFDGLVTLNGSYCEVGETLVHEVPIEPKDVAQAVTYLGDYPEAVCLFCEKDEVFLSETAVLSKEMVAIHTGIHSDMPVRRAIGRALETSIYQMAIHGMDHKESLEALLKACSFTQWSWDGFDIIAKQTNKLEGIKKMAQHFGVPITEVAAVGDGLNDMEMLAGVGIGVAMGNAQEKVKAVANHITNDIDADGLFNAVQFLLKGKAK